MCCDGLWMCLCVVMYRPESREEGGGGRDGLWMCLCVVISDSMVFHCNFILGSVCHGSGRHRLFGSSDLSLICIGHRTVDAAIN